MTKAIEKIVTSVCVFLLVVILGCAAFQDVLTPAYVHPAVLKYVNANGTSILPWTTLYDAKRIDYKLHFVRAKHKIIDELEYKYLAGASLVSVEAGEELKASLFHPTGPIGLLVTATLGGTVGAVLIPRPKDKKTIKKLEKQNNSKNA